MELKMLRGIGTYSFPLKAGEECPAGTFLLDLASGRFEWSEEVFHIHGYAPGEVVPTLELLMAHKHPQDRAPIRRMIAELSSNGGQRAIFHRLIDSKGQERRVFTAAEACLDDSGNVTALRGFTVDLSRTVAMETRHAAAEAIRATYASREVIEQAKGIIMGFQGVTADQAFRVLATRSQHTNVKLATVAVQLVQAATRGKAPEAISCWEARTEQLDPTA
jgi:ANTAR domain-containing protein/PAS domain-containing protein